MEMSWMSKYINTATKQVLLLLWYVKYFIVFKVCVVNILTIKWSIKNALIPHISFFLIGKVRDPDWTPRDGITPHSNLFF